MKPFAGLLMCTGRDSGVDLPEKDRRKMRYSGMGTPSRVCIMLTIAYLAPSAEAKDYCQMSNFTATCQPGEVILMSRALYGRMSLGPCLSREYKVGCSGNVLHHMDQRCSGRSHCVVFIPDPAMVQAQPCHRDLVVYLEADYTCVRGPLVTSQQCHRTSYLNVSGPSGYLPSQTTVTTGAGSSQCPWSITVQPGQTINITLYNFQQPSHATSVSAPHDRNSATSSTASSHCSAPLARVLELDKKAAKESVVCRGERRHQVVYTSSTHRIILELLLNGASWNSAGSSSSRSPIADNTTAFLLKYEAVGCPNPTPPEGATMKRRGDQADIICNGSNQAWHLVCRATAWVGEIGNCSKSSPPYQHNSEVANPDRLLKFPNGLWIAIIIGVALGVMLGFCLLISVFVYRARLRQSRNKGHMREANALLSETRPDVADINKPSEQVTYACRLHPNTSEASIFNQSGSDASPENCSNFQMTLLHNSIGRRPGHVYEKPSPGGEVRSQRFSTFKQLQQCPDVRSISSAGDYDRTVSAISCPHNYAQHYGDPSLLLQQQELQITQNNSNNSNRNIGCFS